MNYGRFASYEEFLNELTLFHGKPAPGGVLAGLARRTLPDVARVAIKSPDDLAAAQQLIAEHSVGAA